MTDCETSITSQENKLYSAVRAYIRREYEGIFREEQFERHFGNYIKLNLSRRQLADIQQVSDLKAGQSLLDIGCGFGAFVLVCRMVGIEAFGIDIAEFEINFARKRLALELPHVDTASVYRKMNGLATTFTDELFDVITLWNVLEHVPDYRQLLRETYRLLRPGGYAFMLAPNYCAFRKEAHYHVPWLPLMPKPIVLQYLRLLSRRSDFFKRHIHYVTNWGVGFALRQLGFRFVIPELSKIANPNLCASEGMRNRLTLLNQLGLSPIVKILVRAGYWNPLKHNIQFVVRKP